METTKSLAVVKKESGLVRELEKREVEVREIDTETMLRELGFKNVSKKLELAKRMAVAYERYMFVTPEKIAAFNEKLRKETLMEDKRAYRYKQLVFVPVAEYGQIPPDHVLRRIKEAIGDKVFDKFEIAKIDWKEEIKDPIVFGRIEGCPDYFYIAQWDDDVKIEDIIFTKEGR